MNQERGSSAPSKEDLTLFLQRYCLHSVFLVLQINNHENLVRSLERELLHMSRKLDRLLQKAPASPPYDPASQRASIVMRELDILSSPIARSWNGRPTRHEDQANKRNGTQAVIQNDLGPLYELMRDDSSPAVQFMKSRIERLASRWTIAGERMRQKVALRTPSQLRVLLYPGVLAGAGGQRLARMVEKGGPLGELVQWADISASFFILGHKLTFTISQDHLHSLIGAAPGRGSCPIQGPIPFDLIYTDYHGLAHLRGAMGLSFQHYQCRFRILDSFGTEPAFNVGEYARKRGYTTMWGSWGLQPLQYMTMFPHTPDNSFMGFVSEEVGDGEASRSQRKENIAVVYGKQAYMWQGKERYLEIISRELEIHGTVYQRDGQPSPLPSFVTNHDLLAQDQLQRLLRRAKLFVGLGFPYEGPAPLEAIALGCVFLQPRFHPPHSSVNNDFYKGKPTMREVHSQHPYTEDFIGKPYVWTVDMDNTTEVQEAVRAILSLKVDPFIPHEFTCEGMLERVYAYIAHQDFCSLSVPSWPSEDNLAMRLGPLGQSCVAVCRHTALRCEPALFHHLNHPTAFQKLGLTCASTEQEVDHLFPAYSPWGRRCSLQQDSLLYSCAGGHPSYRRLCPCRAFQPGQVALCPGCL
ncbi:alpha-1,6-mannosylglycoprotein 6-beta-N-acetylglucosaminyltransferase B-like [Scleropages formosus]|uniref:alpha-1,6-mannosyl-glycoprotein 6-beta-N-acetylglucosaminyltransferase n=1 Tax=Scleropages formosus TaxID=113540 RepID=A0A0N8JWK8_SCLFO|nr:alpha-1,6-mannosylglycoprotein 6-beta-N-acetylglucosaminyltransferase B-like [Scleropages formosus]